MATSTAELHVGLNGLAYYLKRICAFLEGDKKTISFPNISQQLQDILVKLAMEWNADFLSGDEFSNNVKIEATKLADIFNKNSNTKLAHEISDGKLGLNVLTYKKTQVNTFKVPQPMRKPSTFNSTLEPPKDGATTMTFKTSCLNIVTRFVKDDSQLVFKFPEMKEAQADFVMDMIQPGTTERSENADVGFGYRHMYAPLWESMKVFNSKYDYKIGYDTAVATKDGMKRIVFEKIPKYKTTKAIDLERAKTPDIVIDLCDEDTLDTSSTSSSSASVNEAKPNNDAKMKNPNENKPIIKRQVEKLIRKISLKMQRGQVLKKFIHDALRRMAEFVSDDRQESIVFVEVSQHQQHFLENIRRLSNNPATYMLFTSDCQKFLDGIKYCINVKKVQYQTKFAKGCVKSDKGVLKNLEFHKIHNTPENIEKSKSLKPKKQQPKVVEAKTLPKAPRAVTKLYDLLRSEVFTVDFVEVTLQRIYVFLLDEQQASLIFKDMTTDHLLFISHVDTIARDEAWYSVFTEYSRRLLAKINRCFKKNILYQSRLVLKRKDIILEKVVTFASKESSGKSDDEETEDILNAASDLSSDLYQVDQDLVARLSAVREELERSRGEQCVLHYLLEMAEFLSRSVEDRLTLSPVSAAEALFIKHLPLLSTLEPAWHTFSRNAQRLLLNIRTHSKKYRLNFDMIDDEENDDVWTLVIEKHLIAADVKKVKMGVSLKRHSIEEMYANCRQILKQKQQTIQHRARSLSGGRRSTKPPAPARDASQRGTRKDQLKAALELPVHSDKALRMMESMGWKGGALGPRGEGITEPIALPLDLATRAGFGHVPSSKKQKSKKAEPKKQKPPKQEAPRNDFQPLDSLAPDLIPPGIIREGLQRKCKTVVLNKDYHMEVLTSILTIMTTDIKEMHFLSKTPVKVLGFLKHVVFSFNTRRRLGLQSDEQNDLVAKISRAFQEASGTLLNLEMRDKTDLFPLIGVVKRESPTPKKKTIDIISLIEDEEETTDTPETAKGQTSETTTASDESTMIWYQEPTTNVSELEKSIDQLLSTVRNKVVTTMTLDNEEESTAPWYHNTQSNSGRYWYFPVKLKQQNQETTTTQEHETTNNQIPECKVLALSAVNKLNSKETDVEINKKRTQSKQTKTDEHTEQSCSQETTTASEIERYEINKNHTKNVTKDSLEINPREAKKMKTSDDHIHPRETTNIQKQQQSTTNIQEQQQATTETQEQQKSNTTNTEQESETTEIRKTGVLVLAKLPMNNNDLTMNRNDSNAKENKVKTKSTVAMRLVTAVNSCDIIVNIENESKSNVVPMIDNDAPIINKSVSTVNNVAPIDTKPATAVNNDALINNKSAATIKHDAPIKNTSAENDNNDAPISNKSASTMNNVASTINKLAPATKNIVPTTNNCDPTTSDVFQTDLHLICKKTKNVKIIDNGIMKNNRKDQNDTDSVTYIVPVESEITVEDIPKNNINKTTQNNTDLKENCCDKNTTKISVSKSEHDEDDDCEIIFDEVDDVTSSIVNISDDDEDVLLISVEQIDIHELTTNSVKENRKNNCKTVAKQKDTTIKVRKDKNKSRNLEAKKTIKKVTREVENGINGPKCEDAVLEKPGPIKERKRPSLDYPKIPPKRCKVLTDYKKVLILPKDYPQTQMDSGKAREIQSTILKFIDYTQESLPFLKCQGIQNGGLVYSCQDEKSLCFLENLMKNMDDLKIVYEFNAENQLSHKISFRINSYMDESVHRVFNRLELYNSGLNCTNWVIIKKEQYGDFTVIYAEVDDVSFNYICEANFVLYAGNDCARFTILWN